MYSNNDYIQCSVVWCIMFECVFRLQQREYEGSVDEEISKLMKALTKLKHTDEKAVKSKEI